MDTTATFFILGLAHYLHSSDRKYLIMEKGKHLTIFKIAFCFFLGLRCIRKTGFRQKIKISCQRKFFLLKRSFLLVPRLGTDLPDPVTNCSAYNATAYTMQFTCSPGIDGGIKQSFFVEVINSLDES